MPVACVCPPLVLVLLEAEDDLLKLVRLHRLVEMLSHLVLRTRERLERYGDSRGFDPRAKPGTAADALPGVTVTTPFAVHVQPRTVDVPDTLKSIVGLPCRRFVPVIKTTTAPT